MKEMTARSFFQQYDGFPSGDPDVDKRPLYFSLSSSFTAGLSSLRSEFPFFS